MAETKKNLKTKDMLIAVFCTILAVLSIVFYFLPAFNVKHRYGPQEEYDQINYSAWEMTKAVFTDTKVIGSNMEGLLYIKDTYAFAVMLSGILMPLGIICTICTTVFAYISWLKNDKFKQYCFLFSLCGMMFTTVTLICTWFIAIQIRDGNNFDFFKYNLKGSISYASFVSLILSFVVAIIACAYNYFLDNFDDEDEEDEDEEENKKVLATAGATNVEVAGVEPIAIKEPPTTNTVVEDKPKTTATRTTKPASARKTTSSTTKSTTAAKKTATKSTASKTTTKKPTTKSATTKASANK